MNLYIYGEYTEWGKSSNRISLCAHAEYLELNQFVYWEYA